MNPKATIRVEAHLNSPEGTPDQGLEENHHLKKSRLLRKNNLKLQWRLKVQKNQPRRLRQRKHKSKSLQLQSQNQKSTNQKLLSLKQRKIERPLNLSINLQLLQRKQILKLRNRQSRSSPRRIKNQSLKSSLPQRMNKNQKVQLKHQRLLRLLNHPKQNQPPQPKRKLNKKLLSPR